EYAGHQRHFYRNHRARPGAMHRFEYSALAGIGALANGGRTEQRRAGVEFMHVHAEEFGTGVTGYPAGRVVDEHHAAMLVENEHSLVGILYNEAENVWGN